MTSSEPPRTFADWHFRAAKDHGISPDRIGFYANLSELRTIAGKLDVPSEDIERYTESTFGVRIQADDIPGGPDVWIFLIKDLPDAAHLDTFHRLEGHGLIPPIEIAVTTRKDVLYAFLLLHEIGHHARRHGPLTPYAQAEQEADAWALDHLGTEILYSAVQP